MQGENRKAAPSTKESTYKESAGKAPAGAFKRIAAILAIVLLAGMYLVTFILAVAGNEKSAQLLRFCFGMTIFVPIFLWVLIWCVGRLFHKKNMASLDILDSNPEERRRMEEALAREMEMQEKREMEMQEKRH